MEIDNFETWFFPLVDFCFFLFMNNKIKHCLNSWLKKKKIISSFFLVC